MMLYDQLSAYITACRVETNRKRQEGQTLRIRSSKPSSLTKGVKLSSHFRCGLANPTIKQLQTNKTSQQCSQRPWHPDDD